MSIESCNLVSIKIIFIIIIHYCYYYYICTQFGRSQSFGHGRYSVGNLRRKPQSTRSKPVIKQFIMKWYSRVRRNICIYVVHGLVHYTSDATRPLVCIACSARLGALHFGRNSSSYVHRVQCTAWCTTLWTQLVLLCASRAVHGLVHYT